MSQQWWRDAVIYQIYPRSWADADGDGIGDLAGITDRLPHLAELGVDAVWLSPFYTSPQNDGGYDVADYRDVDPLFGTLEDADRLIERAHELGLRLIVDLVPNHSSDQHPWFQEALRSDPGSRARARYVFRDGRGPEGAEPPNNWTSNFGGPAWTRLPDGQWYLHLFDTTQPDFDWDNPEVAEEMESVIRFWLDRGVDGFRIDVAHGLVKEPGLPDASASHEMALERTSALPMWDQPGVHAIYRRWRRITDSYAQPGEDRDRILCAEAWVAPVEQLALYVRRDELHQSFNFSFLMAPWRADLLRQTITESLEAVAAVGAPQTWVLSNHDVVRHATRLAYPPPDTARVMEGIGVDDPQPDAALGLRRARAATTLMLALPGCAYLYQGEELGLPEATRLPDDVRLDPTWARTDHQRRGRDGCRVPVPWEAAAPSYGFGPQEHTWLPQPEAYGALAVDRQRGVPGSTYELYRRLLATRRARRLGTGTLRWTEDSSRGDAGRVLSFEVASSEGEVTHIVANTGSTAVELPDDIEIILASDDLDGTMLPADTAVWFVARSLLASGDVPV